MNIRNCTRCGKIYNYDGFNKVCHNCRQDDENDFQKVKEYLDEFPGATVSQVSEETEVSAKKIIEFLRNGRLEIREGSNLILECEKCGKSIKTGRFCEKCADNIQKELSGVVEEPKQNKLEKSKESEKIRIIDRYSK